MTLSEVAQALREHPGVRDAAVILLSVDAQGEKLVGYVVPKSEYLEQVLAGSEEERKRIQTGRKTFDLMQYGKDAASAALAFNIAGWNSSYTRQPNREALPVPELLA